MKRILVTCPPMLRQISRYEHEFEQARFSIATPDVVQTLPESELVRLVPDFDGWIIGDDPANATVFSAGAAGRLRAAVKWGVGTDNVDFDAARKCGIRIEHTPGVFGAEVADLGMHYLIGLMRHTYLINQEVRAGGWPKPAGRSLSSITVGLVGYGDIGRNFARRAVASDLSLIVYDPSEKHESDVAPFVLRRWPDEIERCDAIVLTCSLSQTSRGMVDPDSLGRMKHGVQLVNVGRGGLIVQHALVEALRSGKVAAAALDVFESEPLPASSPLREFPQCVFGSHNASNTLDAVDRVSRMAISKMVSFLNG